MSAENTCLGLAREMTDKIATTTYLGRLGLFIVWPSSQFIDLIPHIPDETASAPMLYQCTDSGHCSHKMTLTHNRSIKLLTHSPATYRRDL